MSVRPDEDDDGERQGEVTRPVERRQADGDPASLPGLIYRVISNGGMLTRLCVLLLVVAVVVVGVAKLAPSDVFLAVLDAFARIRA